jgi:hypothetical protein
VQLRNLSEGAKIAGIQIAPVAKEEVKEQVAES